MNTTGDVRVAATFDIDALAAVQLVVYLPSTGGLATAHEDCKIRCWDRGGALEAVLDAGGDSSASALAAGPSGGLLAAYWDTAVRVWTGSSCAAVLKGHTSRIRAMAPNPADDHMVITGSDDTTVRVWDVPTASCTAVLKGHCGMVWGVVVMPNGDIVSGSWDSTVRVWDAGGACKSTLRLPDMVFGVVLLPDGSIVAGGGGAVCTSRGFLSRFNGTRTHWTVEVGEVVHKVLPAAYMANHSNTLVFFDSDGGTVGSATPSGPSLFAAVDGRRAVALTQDKHVFMLQRMRVARFWAIQALGTAWAAHHGQPPRQRRGWAAAVARTLSMRRFCRVRGKDAEGMEWEVVEPFGREVVKFL